MASYKLRHGNSSLAAKETSSIVAARQPSSAIWTAVSGEREPESATRETVSKRHRSLVCSLSLDETMACCGGDESVAVARIEPKAARKANRYPFLFAVSVCK